MMKSQAKDFCRSAGVPPNRCARFTQAVERCVACYRRVRSRKTSLAVEKELNQIEKRVLSSLRMLDHKTWRPGKFQESLESISAAFANLSRPASEVMQFRNAKVVSSIPAGWSPTTTSDVVIDPTCFSCLEDQGRALEELLGALAGPVANKRRARPRTDNERALYHCLAVAFTRATGKAASDSSDEFMTVCQEIKEIYQLDHWHPESLPRLARRLRADRR